jgi:hypothetical protein
MSTSLAIHGLSCPRCGGMVPVPEGQAVVRCPFCDLRSVVRGERGVLRYHVPQQVEREHAVQSFQKFLGKWAIARDCGRQAELTDVFLVHLPFWATWGRTVGWVFGQKEEGSGDHRHLEPREVKVVEEMTWNAAACDVGEFGVNQISLTGRSLVPFDPDALHRSGMVFEPVGSASEALKEATREFEQRVQQQAGLDRVSQSFVRVLNPRLGLVYYPLWVVRYRYRGRAFQVVVDGFSGEVLYGKAPGNNVYRAAVLVGGMALGAFLSIDVGGAILAASGNSSRNSSGGFEGALVLFVVGLAVMYGAYRTFRYGEHYEYRAGGARFGALPGVSEAGRVIKALNQLR